MPIFSITLFGIKRILAFVKSTFLGVSEGFTAKLSPLLFDLNISPP